MYLLELWIIGRSKIKNKNIKFDFGCNLKLPFNTTNQLVGYLMYHIFICLSSMDKIMTIIYSIILLATNIIPETYILIFLLL